MGTKIIIRETLEKVINLDEPDEKIARSMVECMYKNEQIVLNADDHVDTEIIVLQK